MIRLMKKKAPRGVINRLDHVSIKVSTAQAFGNESSRVNHYNVVQMRKVFVAEKADLLNGRYYSFFVTRYVWISQKRVFIPPWGRRLPARMLPLVTSIPARCERQHPYIYRQPRIPS